MTYVYVFDFGDMVKVGTSKRPLARLKEIEKGNGVKAVRTFAIAVGEAARLVEQKIHLQLDSYLLQGHEYFCCSFEVARNAALHVARTILGRPVVGIRVGSVVSDAQKEATARYNKKAYDRIEIKVKKGRKNLIFKHAAMQGKSVNQFIVELIEEAMKEDT